MAKLTLTFDNGPIPGATERILDLLKERGLQVTFFVVGEKLAAPGARSIVERARQEGHRIGNHTMHHRQPLGEFDDAGDSVEEIAGTQALLGGLADPDRLFRPQGRGKVGPHLLSPAALDHLLDNRYTMVTWNNVPGDWLEPERAWFDKALEDMATQDWTVLVLHDHCQIRMMDLLVSFLDRVEKEELEMRTDFPDSCLPIVRGELMVDKSDIATGV